MDNQSTVENEHNDYSNSNGTNSSTVLDIYPLSCYYFGSKDAVPLRNETVADRVLRMKAKYDAYGMRACVAAVIVSCSNTPISCCCKYRTPIYKLPGGRARFGESDIDCLKRKLLSKLCVGEESRGPEWEVGKCLGMWWRPDFETLLYPCLPQNIKRPKECTKLFLVKLPASRRFTVPKNFKLLAVPLCQIHDNEKIYGPIISGVPQLLSKLSFNIVKP
ncbi:Pre-mRNA cleavage factor Im 25 kDa subunit 1 [Abeliophyllum distichum]|uniref:Pre-mRNA cleavage factor Im 25 kDa subunit n=1 Tax=Abeliophyllum distichum TaxID=126358 RepID=A0ABD1VAH7_9LAMI